MSKIKVLITDPIEQTGLKMMEAEGYEIRQEQKLSNQDFLSIVKDYDAIICRSSTKIGADIIEAAENLKCIAITSTGWDTIDIDKANEKNIAVFGQPAGAPDEDVTRKGSFTPTAEHTMLLMLAAAGDFYNISHKMKQGEFAKFGFAGTELLDKTLGIVGFGRIGQLVAKRAKAFEMNIIAYNRDSENKFVNLDFPVEFVALDELCQRSDFITVHMPKTPETVNFIAKKHLELMKKQAVIINTARGGIINEEDLVEALKNNKIRGAALDVFVSEGENLNMDLISLPNVLATPHIAGVSQEGQKRRSVATADNIIGFFRSGNIKNLINKYKKD